MEYTFFQEFELPKRPTVPSYSIKITDFGAEEGSLCTKSIAAAIENVSEHGGGHVIFPKGVWKTGAIQLKSNIDLHFEEGAVLDFSTDLKDYLPVVPVVYEGIRCLNHSPFIYGYELENISITGTGFFEGNGEAWWSWAQNRTGLLQLYTQGNTAVPIEERVYGKEELSLRSPFVQFIRCKNLLIEGAKFHHSPFWTIDPVWCENMIIRDVTIENQNPSPNSDGINVDACRNVIVEDCTIESAGDDLFCLKAGRNTDGRAVGIPCENVIIRRCRSTGKCQSGGIVVGSEMSAGVRNILAEDCTFAHNASCIRFKAKDGRGGIVENIECRNLHLQKGMRGINLTYRYAGKNIPKEDDPAIKGEYMPVFRNFLFENISCDEVELGIAIDGIKDGKMENIHFKNIRMRAKTCLTADSVDGLYMENVRLKQIEID